MKKLFALVIVAVLSFSIVACKKSDTDTVAEDKTVEDVVTDSTNLEAVVAE